MIWGNTRESINDLLLTIGTTIIVLGFIELMGITKWNLVIAGVVITIIGIIRAMKNMREKGIVPDWEKKKGKKKGKRK